MSGSGLGRARFAGMDSVRTTHGAPRLGNRTPLGPYRRPMPRVLGGSQGGGHFLMGEVPPCGPMS